jgi:hypothetical protein
MVRALLSEVNGRNLLLAAKAAGFAAAPSDALPDNST